jgi:hypothetical protein
MESLKDRKAGPGGVRKVRRDRVTKGIGSHRLSRGAKKVKREVCCAWELLGLFGSRMATTYRTTSGFVLRRIVHGAVIVASHHQAIGPLYWNVFDGTRLGGLNHHGITTMLKHAYRFQRGTVPFDAFLEKIYKSNTHVVDAEVTHQNGQVETTAVRAASGDFVALADLAGLSPQAIVDWIRTTAWIEIPAPPVMFFLRRYDGSVGHRSEWTATLAEAHRFSASRVLIGEELGEIRRHGRLVPVGVAGIFPQSVATARDDINHALEADVAWTLHRHKLGTPGVARKALQHAGTAGWIFAGTGGDSVSGHIAEFPQLLDAFETGRVLYASLHSAISNKET